MYQPYKHVSWYPIRIIMPSKRVWKNQNETRKREAVRGANEGEEARRRSREKKMLAIQYFAIMSNNNKST